MWCARRLSFGCSAVPRAAGYLLLRRGCARALGQACRSRLPRGFRKRQLTRFVRLPRAIQAAREMPGFGGLVSYRPLATLRTSSLGATDPSNSQFDSIPGGHVSSAQNSGISQQRKGQAKNRAPRHRQPRCDAPPAARLPSSLVRPSPTPRGSPTGEERQPLSHATRLARRRV